MHLLYSASQTFFCSDCTGRSFLLRAKNPKRTIKGPNRVGHSFFLPTQRGRPSRHRVPTNLCVLFDSDPQKQIDMQGTERWHADILFDFVLFFCRGSLAAGASKRRGAKGMPQRCPQPICHALKEKARHQAVGALCALASIFCRNFVRPFHFSESSTGGPTDTQKKIATRQTLAGAKAVTHHLATRREKGSAF